jgi:hypothetical protein
VGPTTDLSGSGFRGKRPPTLLCFPIGNGVLVSLLRDSPPARDQEPGSGTQPCGISATTDAARCDRMPDRSVAISYRVRPSRTLPRRRTSSKISGGWGRRRRGRRDLGRLSPRRPGFTRSPMGAGAASSGAILWRWACHATRTPHDDGRSGRCRLGCGNLVKPCPPDATHIVKVASERAGRQARRGWAAAIGEAEPTWSLPQDSPTVRCQCLDRDAAVRHFGHNGAGVSWPRPRRIAISTGE